MNKINILEEWKHQRKISNPLNHKYVTGMFSKMAAETEGEVETMKSSLSSGVMHILQPSVEALDNKVHNVRCEIFFE